MHAKPEPFKVRYALFLQPKYITIMTTTATTTKIIAREGQERLPPRWGCNEITGFHLKYSVMSMFFPNKFNENREEPFLPEIDDVHYHPVGH